MIKIQLTNVLYFLAEVYRLRYCYGLVRMDKYLYTRTDSLRYR